jgi:hypothetical protein
MEERARAKKIAEEAAKQAHDRLELEKKFKAEAEAKLAMERVE